MKMFTPNYLASLIVKTVTDNDVHNPSVININKKSLSAKGDLSFQLGLNFWRGYVDPQSNLFRKSKNILEYFERKNSLNSNEADHSNDEILKKLTEIIEASLKQQSHLECKLISMAISKNFVLVNLERSIVSYNAIKNVLHKEHQFGKPQSSKSGTFCLSIEEDKESEITNLRLSLQKKVSENLLKFQSYSIQSNECENSYLFTSKSEGKSGRSEKRYLCGTVLNSQKKKEKVMTKDEYLQKKVEKIKEVNSQKCDLDFDDELDNVERNLQKIAEACINYELLSTKHNSSVIIGNSDDEDKSIKEASFVLYNNVRIKAILDKYTHLMESNRFPQIIPINDFKSFDKTMDDDSWALVYNYIMKLPDLLESVVTVEPKFEINIHILWSFVSHLCHDFSRYYRRTRILLGGTDFNDQIIKMVTERLHMLKSLRIVLQSSLNLLGIEEIEHM